MDCFASLAMTEKGRNVDVSKGDGHGSGDFRGGVTQLAARIRVTI